MRGLQQIAPEMKKLQEKYKDDKQRLQPGDDEALPGAQGEPVRLVPAAPGAAAGLHLALLPAAGRPARRDLRPERGPCGELGGQAAASPSSSSSRTSPTTRPARVLIALIVLYVGSQLAVVAADVGLGGQEPAHDLPGAAVHLHPVHHQLPGRPARLLDHDEPLDDRAAVHRPADRRARGQARPRDAGGRRGRRRDDGDGGALRKALGGGPAPKPRGARRRRRPGAGTSALERTARRRRRKRKKKRSGTTALDGREHPGGEALQRLLERVADALDLDATVVGRRGRRARSPARCDGEDLGLFIGRHGQTIEAVQHLAQRVVGEARRRRAPAPRRRRRRRLPRAPRAGPPAPGRRGRRRARSSPAAPSRSTR